MRITELMSQKAKNCFDNRGVTIACLGDSVTQGCFDVFVKLDGQIETIFDQEHAYHSYFKKMLAKLYPNVPINIINAGISGGNASHAYERLERDVLRYNPDLVIVCFGLNDVVGGIEKLNNYTDALKNIFNDIKKSGAELIFLTPNMLNTEISPHLYKHEVALETATIISGLQNEGIMDIYMEAAIKTCEECGVIVCDCYKKWKAMYKCGVNITELLSNKINHPTEELNKIFAYSLVETIFTN